MTRALTAMSHLQPLTAFHYHPWSWVVWPPLVILAASAVISPLRRRVLTFVARHDRQVTLLFWGLLCGYLAYGVLRMVGVFPDYD